MKKVTLISAIAFGAYAGAVAQDTSSYDIVLIDGTNGIAEFNGAILEITTSKTLTADTQWVLTEQTFVTGGVLTIEPGTIVRGDDESTAGGDVGALIVTRDARINAQGTPADPIIFTTASLDVNGVGAIDGGKDTPTQVTAGIIAANVGGNGTFEPDTDTLFYDNDPKFFVLEPYNGYDAVATDSRYERDASTSAATDNTGLWGGIVILGNAPTSIGEIQVVSNNGDNGSGDGFVLDFSLNKSDDDDGVFLNDAFEGAIEGLTLSIFGERIVYGGTNPNDNSGVFSYCSIRHAGNILGEANELNGLTMGGVGAGTKIDHVEVYNNADDGFEWFGGTVNTSNLVSLFNNDDSFDIDEGFTGLGQFWFSLQADDGANGDHGGEHDGTNANFSSVDVASINGVDLDTEGGLDGEDSGGGVPLTYITVYNATYIGTGATTIDAPQNLDSEQNTAFRIRDSWGGAYYNSIFSDFADFAIRVDSDGRDRWDTGDVVFRSNIFNNFALGATDGSFSSSATASDYVRDGTAQGTDVLANTGVHANNVLNTDPFAVRRVLTPGAFGSPDIPAKFDRRTGLDPRADDTVGAVTSDLEPLTATFFSTATYKGAFDPAATTLWTDGWTAGSIAGYIEVQ